MMLNELNYDSIITKKQVINQTVSLLYVAQMELGIQKQLVLIIQRWQMQMDMLEQLLLLQVRLIHQKVLLLFLLMKNVTVRNFILEKKLLTGIIQQPTAKD